MDYRKRSEPGANGGAVDRKSARAMILPLALAQFICSYAATNMNVAISAIAKDLGTTVAGVQTAITMFTLTMAAPGLLLFGIAMIVMLAFTLLGLVLGILIPRRPVEAGQPAGSATAGVS